ncbi:MAG: ABC transporter permease [Coriobacteriia bacterium]|nr:ABC transporter permease [Coriobacteriia bacterium]
MQVFKTTLRIIFRSPLYLLLYIVFFGCLGLILVSSVSSSMATQHDSGDRSDQRPSVAIIDRDQSVVSVGFGEFLADRSTLIDLRDDVRELQLATAQNLASYIVIVPEGFGEGFLEAAHSNSAPPRLETVVNYAEDDGVVMDLLVKRYLQALYLTIALAPDAALAEVLDTTAAATSLQAELSVAALPDQPTTGWQEVFYFLWIAYPLSLGLIVLTGVMFATFRTGELKRRNLCSPLSSSRMNLQIALGGVSLIFMTWGFLMLLSLLPIVDGLSKLLVNPLSFALLCFATLVYALVPFSIGFLLSQLGLKEMALNGAANIISLAFCFLSGIFMGGISMLGEPMQVIGQFIPTYWYSEAIMSLAQGGLSSEVLVSYFTNLGVVVLFALAIFSVALLAGRREVQGTDAGGNTAAEAIV